MGERPPVTVGDPLEGPADLLDAGPSRRSRLPRAAVVLAVGCAAGVLGANVLDGRGTGAPLPRVVAVADHEISRGADDGRPRSAVEVTLVNTGSRLVVLGGELPYADLSFDAGTELGSGEQSTHVLVDPAPCRGPDATADAPVPVLAVDVLEDGDARRLTVPLDAAFFRDRDTELSTACRASTSGALAVVLGEAQRDGGGLSAPIALANRTGREVRLLSVSSMLPGTTAALRGREGRQLALPLTVPGSQSDESSAAIASQDPYSSPYLLSVAVAGSACPRLLERGGETVTVALSYAYVDEPRGATGTFLALDLPALLSQGCPAPEPS